jgi:hypothetical protein
MKRKKLFVCIMSAICLVILACVCVLLFTSAGRYLRAEHALLRGDYEAALSLFSAMEDYRDSEEKAELAQNGIDRVNAKKGDFIVFGRYEQDGNAKNGPDKLKWKVLAVEDGKMLVLCRDAIALMPFQKEWVTTTWKDSDIRAWLSDAFYENAFSEDEKRYIALSTLENEGNDKFGTEGCGQTYDRVFLLSAKEARKYCKPSTLLQTKATTAAKNSGEPLTDAMDKASVAWWLRSSGGDDEHIAIVYTDATVDTYGIYPFFDNICVRPAMWIEIDP